MASYFSVFPRTYYGGGYWRGGVIARRLGDDADWRRVFYERHLEEFEDILDDLAESEPEQRPELIAVAQDHAAGIRGAAAIRDTLEQLAAGRVAFAHAMRRMETEFARIARRRRDDVALVLLI